jgi:hypothetical protein
VHVSRRLAIAITFTLASAVAAGRAAADPTASLRFSPSSQVVGQAVAFDASASTTDSPGGLCCYRWHFGDLTRFVGSTSQARHVFLAPGTYTVTLTVSDATDASEATVQKTVSVAPAPPGSPAPVTAGSPCDEYGLPLPKGAGGNVYEDAVAVAQRDGLSCLAAAQLAHRFDVPYYSGHRPARRISSGQNTYRCRIVNRGSDFLNGRCVRGSRVVKWHSGHQFS